MIWLSEVLILGTNGVFRFRVEWWVLLSLPFLQIVLRSMSLDGGCVLTTKLPAIFRAEYMVVLLTRGSFRVLPENETTKSFVTVKVVLPSIWNSHCLLIHGKIKNIYLLSHSLFNSFNIYIFTLSYPMISDLVELLALHLSRLLQSFHFLAVGILDHLAGYSGIHPQITSFFVIGSIFLPQTFSCA